MQDSKGGNELFWNLIHGVLNPRALKTPYLKNGYWGVFLGSLPRFRYVHYVKPVPIALSIYLVHVRISNPMEATWMVPIQLCSSCMEWCFKVIDRVLDFYCKSFIERNWLSSFLSFLWQCYLTNRVKKGTKYCMQMRRKWSILSCNLSLTRKWIFEFNKYCCGTLQWSWLMIPFLPLSIVHM